VPSTTPLIDACEKYLDYDGLSRKYKVLTVGAEITHLMLWENELAADSIR